MALTKDQLLERRGYIGSSDVPALLGVDPYRNVMDVWLKKTGRTDPEPTTSRAADLGERLERPLVQIVADALETPVSFDRRRTVDDVLSSQADGWLDDLNELIEAKAYGLWNRFFDPAGWGDEGTDQVPFRVLAQVVFGMHVHGCDRAHVTALLGGGLGHRMYVIHRSQDLIDEIVRRALTFWHDHVQADVPPEGVANIDTLKEVVRQPEKIVEIDHDLPGRWRNLTDQEKLIAGVKDALKADIIQRLGDAEVGYTPFGSFTYKANRRGVRSLRFQDRSDS